jgi:hypothetical protein
VFDMHLFWWALCLLGSHASNVHLPSGHLPMSTSQVARITGLSHCGQLWYAFLSINIFLLQSPHLIVWSKNLKSNRPRSKCKFLIFKVEMIMPAS